MLGSKRLGLSKGWLKAYFESKQDTAAWRAAVTQTGGLLWKLFVSTIWQALDSRSEFLNTRLIIVPPPLLSLIPWHASWREVEGKRRFACEEYPIAYAPSLAIYAALQARAASRPWRVDEPLSSLVVADTELNLPFASIEGVCVGRLAGTESANLLVGTASSYIAVGAAIQKKQLVHFACHGRYDLREPMWSYLSLGRYGMDLDGATGNLRLRELITGWKGIEARLIVLSACETAIGEILYVPYESLSLATGWFAAGASGVVSSFWAVDDFCTLILMSRFYLEYLPQGTNSTTEASGNGSLALRKAQLWLKTASASELASAVSQLEGTVGLSTEQLDVLRTRRAALESFDAESTPYSEPHWWSGFGYTGA